MRLSEISREVALIAHSNPVHNLFDAQERAFQKRLCLLHPERLEILRERHPCLSFKEITKVSGRKIHSIGHLAQSQLPAQVFLQQAYNLLNSMIHIPHFELD